MVGVEQIFHDYLSASSIGLSDCRNARPYSRASRKAESSEIEQVVFDLQHKFDSKPSSDNWLDKLIGSISDDSAFLEALEYGRAFRQSDKPIDDADK